MKNIFFRNLKLSTVSILLNLTLTSALSALNIPVNTVVDYGDGSLRNALQIAKKGDSIVFDSNLTGTIFLDSSLPIISQDLSIQGSNNVSIDGQNSSQIFFVYSGNVSLNNLAIYNGLALGGEGGDLLVEMAEEVSAQGVDCL